MNFEFKCPQCGQMVEADESFRGQVAQCPHCGKGIVVPRGKSKLGVSPVPPPHQRDGKMTIPRRFSNPMQEKPATTPPDAETASPKKKRGLLFKVIIILSIVIGAAIAIGSVSYGCYLYFGDKPRLERGIKYFESKNYEKAFALLAPLAKKGYSQAQLHLGDCYAHGNGVMMNSEEAVKWYRAAAEQELAPALHRMYECCRDGMGVERNLGNAVKWCRKAAEAGFEEGMFDMGMLYVHGTGVEENAKSAFKWFRRGAEKGHPMSLYKFGQCYKLGYGTDKDEDEAQKWQNKAVEVWKKAADGGDTDAMVRLAELHKEGDVVELDKEESVKWYRKAAESGNAIAQLRLALCYHDGEGIEQDAEEAAKWMLKSAEQGTSRESQWLMGRFYEDGTGVEKNLAEAVKWFERAEKKGFYPAKYSLAMCYLHGKGVQKDESRAEALLKEAAAGGNESAKKELRRIKDERMEEQHRLEREKAEKQRKIEEMREIEKEISERKTRINAILAGKHGGDWLGFDAGKITETDSSVNVKEEELGEAVSEISSEKDSLGKMNGTITSLKAELSRLEARLEKIVRVKKVYDEKELESRKEKCAQCDGNGSVKCVRCKGEGSFVVREARPCGRCGGSNGGSGFGAEFESESYKGAGRIKVEVECSNCYGKGMVRPKCRTCNGKGRIKTPNVTGKLSNPYETCPGCNGSGHDFETFCPKCSGDKKVEVWQRCPACGGKGELSAGKNVTCPVCQGHGNLKCDRCGGRGFTYRPKN